MLNVTLDSLGLETVRGDESFVSRVQDMPVSKEEFFDLTKMAKYGLNNYSLVGAFITIALVTESIFVKAQQK